MGRFLKQILVFLIPLIAGTVLLFAWPYPGSFALQYTRGECDGQSYWINKRLQMEEPVDVLLIGSSRMIDGVNDQLLTQLLSEKEGKPMQVMNAGFCRLGRDVQWWIVQQVLAHKTPKTLILEVRETEPKSGHPVFGYLANSSQLLEEPLFTNPRYFENWYHGFLSRLDRMRYHINDFEIEEPWHEYPLYGYGAWPGPIDTMHLKTTLAERDQEQPVEPAIFPSISKTYLGRIERMLRAQDISLYFLYLPSLGSPYKQPAQVDYYRQQGQSLIPPDSLRQHWYFYRDGEHLNSNGAAWLTQWLAAELEKPK